MTNKNNNFAQKYAQQKMDFLDSLQPDDFRNGSSFNQAELIIDELNEEAYRAMLNQKDPQEFIKKAVSHLFREGSDVVNRAVELARSYVEMKLRMAMKIAQTDI